MNPNVQSKIRCSFKSISFVIWKLLHVLVQGKHRYPKILLRSPALSTLKQVTRLESSGVTGRFPMGFNCHLVGIMCNSVSRLFSRYNLSQRSPALSIPEELVYLQDRTTQNVFPLARLTWTETFFVWPRVRVSKQSGNEALLSSKTKLYLIQISLTLFWGLRNKLFLYAIPNVRFPKLWEDLN